MDIKTQHYALVCRVDGFKIKVFNSAAKRNEFLQKTNNTIEANTRQIKHLAKTGQLVK